MHNRLHPAHDRGDGRRIGGVLAVTVSTVPEVGGTGLGWRIGGAGGSAAAVTRREGHVGEQWRWLHC